MDYETVLLDVSDGVATLTLNRPEQMNAFTLKMMREMIDAFDRIDADDDVRAVVVTGAGRAFCAGADLGAGAGSFDYDDLDIAELSPDRAKREFTRDGGGML